MSREFISSCYQKYSVDRLNNNPLKWILVVCIFISVSILQSMFLNEIFKLKPLYICIDLLLIHRLSCMIQTKSNHFYLMKLNYNI